MRSLSDEDVENIRKLKPQGFTLQQLADKYKCSRTTILLWLEVDPQKRNEKFRYKYNRRVVCKKCPIPIEIHPLCPVCESLLHERCDCQDEKIYYSDKIRL